MRLSRAVQQTSPSVEALASHAWPRSACCNAMGSVRWHWSTGARPRPMITATTSIVDDAHWSWPVWHPIHWLSYAPLQACGHACTAQHSHCGHWSESACPLHAHCSSPAMCIENKEQPCKRAVMHAQHSTHTVDTGQKVPVACALLEPSDVH
jgi:hypothetical protein